MVLEVAYTLISSVLPSKYYLHVGVTAVVLLVIYAFAQGRTTNRERDLHARVILVTGGFTPLGLTLLSALATRGAHIIAISPYPLVHAYPSLLIPLLRSTTNNENIFAEYADLADPASIREFCTRFLTGQDQRLDAIVFGHEYHGIGRLFGLGRNVILYEEQRETASIATFLMITLLLPALLVEPVERDIRIINVINPFYAAAAPSFTSAFTSTSLSSVSSSLFLLEGHRALRTTVLTRHLQRVLDSLPNHATTNDPNAQNQPATSSSSSKANSKLAPNSFLQTHPSNIIATSVCPGISRKDTIAPHLGAERDVQESLSMLGAVIYALFFPLFLLLSKSPNAALQSILHVLFLPTPLKRVLAQVDATVNPSVPIDGSAMKSHDKEEERRVVFEEVLKPGALYRECAVVQVNVPPLPPSNAASDDKDKTKRKKEASGKEGTDAEYPDDKELGGEAVGRVVWEWYEEKLKVWEATKAKADEQREKGESQPEAR